MRHRRRTLQQRGRGPQRQVSEVRPDGRQELFTDKELTDLDLAADPDPRVPSHALPIDDYLTAEDPRDADDHLPSWYMPAIARRSLDGWRRRVVLLIVISFAVTAVYGVCSVYGIFGL